MFWDIPQPIVNRMAYLEAVDMRDRRDDTPHLERLRQIPPETGKFLCLLAANAPDGFWLEVGASGGYSGLWLSQACRVRNQRLTTFEILPEKALLAQETFRVSGAEQYIDLVQGDARILLPDYRPVGFCFVDAEKDIYLDSFEKVAPNMVSGAIFVADNAISHQMELQSFIEYVVNDRRMDALVVPIGKGLLICRKL